MKVELEPADTLYPFVLTEEQEHLPIAGFLREKIGSGNGGAARWDSRRGRPSAKPYARS